ncbi:MAG: hypothetical protein H7Z37_00150 [Pyrinomonadaceae bacterium]|nr:hypothetical protein [Pyrinomonadaceae bacterium]
MATAAKKATTKTQDVAEQTQENVNSMIAIGQDTANVALDGMVQTAKVANTTMQNMVNVGLNAQEAGISVARNYFDNMNRIGKEMIDIFARNGEKTINSVSDMEFAIQREATDIAKDVDEKTEKAVENQVGKSNAR